MTLEQKELLIKDLCARLPYGVKVQVFNYGIEAVETLYEIDLDGYISTIEGDTLKYSYKPYLFPFSSMTDELWDKEFRGYNITEFTRDSFKYGCETLEFYDHNPDLSDMIGFINQLIKHHFDIYGLISKGLAIDATELNIYQYYVGNN